MSDKTGGPAFPIESFTQPNGEFAWGSDGLTLRDYFAAKAMQAALSNQLLLNRIGEQVSNDLELGHMYLAEGAYRLADAMLRERDK